MWDTKKCLYIPDAIVLGWRLNGRYVICGSVRKSWLEKNGGPWWFDFSKWIFSALNSDVTSLVIGNWRLVLEQKRLSGACWDQYQSWWWVYFPLRKLECTSFLAASRFIRPGWNTYRCTDKNREVMGILEIRLGGVTDDILGLVITELYSKSRTWKDFIMYWQYSEWTFIQSTRNLKPPGVEMLIKTTFWAFVFIGFVLRTLSENDSSASINSQHMKERMVKVNFM